MTAPTVAYQVHTDNYFSLNTKKINYKKNNYSNYKNYNYVHQQQQVFNLNLNQ